MAVRLRSPRNWTLRAQLITSVLALLVLVCAGIGVFADIAVKKSLIQKLDQQLGAGQRRTPATGTSAVRRAAACHRARRSDRSASRWPAELRSAPGYRRSRTADFRTAPASAEQALLQVKADGRPHNAEVPGLGDYRAIATVPDERGLVPDHRAFR